MLRRWIGSCLLVTFVLPVSVSVADDGQPSIFSKSWWQMKACDPVGARQKYKFGKYWPPYPRPMGKEQAAPHIYHAAKYWPYPYQCQDRHYVRQISQLHQDAGWVMATTLYDYHFEPHTNVLNRSGRLQLRWILETAPPQNRIAYVQTTYSAESNQNRVSSVQEEAIAMVGPQNALPVMLRVTSPLGRPALEVDTIRRRELDTMFDPRISHPLTSGEATPEGGLE